MRARPCVMVTRPRRRASRLVRWGEARADARLDGGPRDLPRRGTDGRRRRGRGDPRRRRAPERRRRRVIVEQIVRDGEPRIELQAARHLGAEGPRDGGRGGARPRAAPGISLAGAKLRRTRLRQAERRLHVRHQVIRAERHRLHEGGARPPRPAPRAAPSPASPREEEARRAPPAAPSPASPWARAPPSEGHSSSTVACRGAGSVGVNGSVSSPSCESSSATTGAAGAGVGTATGGSDDGGIEGGRPLDGLLGSSMPARRTRSRRHASPGTEKLARKVQRAAHSGRRPGGGCRRETRWARRSTYRAAVHPARRHGAREPRLHHGVLAAHPLEQHPLVAAEKIGVCPAGAAWK